VRIPSGDGFGFTGTDVRKLACESSAKTNSTLVGGKRDTSSATLLNSWPIPAWPNYGFCGGVFDGISVWLVPYDASQVVRIFTANYSTRGYGNWPLSGFSKGAAAFVGGVFDGSSIWLVPYNADRVVRLFTDNGTMVGYPNWPVGFAKGTKAFAGASFDGISLWMVPQNADQVVRLFCNNGSMVAYADWAAAGLVKKTVAFSGGVIAAGSFWLFPFYADRLVQVSLDNGTMKGHNNWPTANGFSYSAGSFIGGVFDGIDSIWLVPYDSDRVVRFFVTNHTMVDYRVWPGGFTKSGNAFAGGTFDGEAVWFAPSTADVVVKIFVANATMVQYPIWPANYTVPSVAFRGALYDGQRVWMLPFEARDVVVLNASEMECSTTSSLTPSASISLERSTPSPSSRTPSASETESKLMTTTPHKTISLLLPSRLSSQSHESLAVSPTSSQTVTHAISVDLTQTTPLAHPQGYGSPSPSETIPFTSGLVMNTPRPVGTDLAMPQTRVTVIVASAGSGAALVASSLSPTMATQASRPFVFLRAIDCKSQRAERTPISDDPEYLELPLQVALPKTSGPYPRYSGSLLVTVVVLLGVPGLLFTIANLLLKSESFRNRKLLLKAQRSIFSSAFLMSVGYFIPTVWKVLVLVAGTHQTEGESAFQLVAVTGVAIIASAIVGFLLYILICRCPAEAQCRPHRTQNGKASPEIPTPLHSRLELTPFLAAYGPLFEARSSVAAAVLGSSLSPTLAVQAARPFVFLRSVNCKYGDGTDTPESDDADSVQLPLQVPLGSGAFSMYAGSMVVSFAVFVGIPTLTLALLHLLIVRYPRLPQWVLLMQRKVVSTAFFMTVGYFVPPTLKVFVLTAAHNGSTGAVLGASICLAVAIAILVFLVEVIVRVVPQVEGLWSLILSPTSGTSKVTNLPEGNQKGSNNVNCRSFLVAVESRHFLGTFGPLFCDARNLDSLPIRVYFFEDLIVSCALQALDGVRPASDDTACSGVAGSMTLIIVLHLVYLARFRPYREKVDWVLAIVGSFILFLSGVCACLTIFSTRESISNVSLLIMGYLAVVESAYFYLQLIVVCCLEIGRAHRRQLQTQWGHCSSPVGELGVAVDDEVGKDGTSLQLLSVPLKVRENDPHGIYVGGTDPSYRNPLLDG
jgi:hypothetical protein